MTTSDSVQKFIADLDRVRVHKSADGTPVRKKPLTLLLVLSRILKGEITKNEIRFADIETELRDLIAKHGSASASSPNPAEPFYYLHTAPFWRVELADTANKPKKVSATLLRKSGSFAAISDELFSSLRTSPGETREAMKAVLAKWWPEGSASDLASQLGL